MPTDDFYPQVWHILHTATARWSKRPTRGEQEELLHLLIGLPALVQCELCKSHIRQWNLQHNLKQITSTKLSAFANLVAMHNSVNRQHGKAEWTLQQAAKYYGYRDF